MSIKLICIVLLIIGCFSIVVNADTSVSCNPSSDTVYTGDTFTVDVLCTPEGPIKAFEFGLSFDSSLLKANSVTEGDIFSGYTTFFDDGIIDNNAGTVSNVFGLIMGAGNVSDSGSFVTISFTAKDNTGTSTLDLTGVGVTDEYGYISISVSDGSVEVEDDGGDDPPPGGGGGGGYQPPPPVEENNPPETPIIPSGPTYVEVGIEYEFSSFAYDVDDDLIRYKFDWGDGNFSNWSSYVFSNVSVNLSHSWNNASTYQIKVIAQDENGENSSWSFPLNISVSQTDIGGEPPVVVINVPENISANSTVVFNASESYAVNGSIVSYEWDFGDGENGSGVAPSHIYSIPGEYIVTLLVTDENGFTFSRSIFITVGSEFFEESLDEEIAFPIDLGFLLIIVIITILFCITIFYRENVVSLMSRFKIDFGFINNIFNTKNKISNIDAKINAIRREIDSKVDLNQRYIVRQQIHTNQYSDMNGSIHRNIDFEISRITDVDQNSYNSNSSNMEEKEIKHQEGTSDIQKYIITRTDPGKVTSEETKIKSYENVQRKVDELIDSKIRVKVDNIFDDS